MIWYLLFAHLVGDFVLQNDWMVRRRDNFWVLSLHGGIHFALMLLLVGPLRSVIWPYMFFLAAIHIIQDRIKNNITNKRPDWTRVAFIIDQFMHFSAIWVLVWWIQREIGPSSVPQKPVWVIIAITYLFITYVWFIIERLFNLSNTDYLQNINKTKLARMLTRFGLVSLLLMFRIWATSSLAFVLSNPYSQKEFGRRALLTDISVSVFALIFLSWAVA